MKHPTPGLDYNPASVDDIFHYALNLRGSSLRQELDIPNDFKFKRRGKGSFGESVEYYYFGYEPNSKSEPDFNEVGLELKVTPLKEIRGGKLVPKERLVITMINFMTVVNERFETSTLYHKISQILMMHYLHDDDSDPFDYEFKLIHLWRIPPEDLPTIQEDWETIVNKIRNGLAHEISGSDTDYLEACTKSSDSSITRAQPYSKIPAKPRAFALKASYIRTIVDNALDAQAIIREKDEQNLSLERLVDYRIDSYIGFTDKELCDRLGIDYQPDNKSLWVKLTYRMLGITNNKSSEFVKANITVRSIRKEANGRIIESMSLTPFEFKELVAEEWERSKLYNYLEETRFLFVVFESDGEDYRLKGCAFWNMPAQLLEGEVRRGWEAIRGVVLTGVQFESKVDENGHISYSNNFPKKRDNAVIHIRPHAQTSAYRFLDGRTVGNVERDASELPDGQWMTKQSFWLNNDFIYSQIIELGL